MDINDDRRSRFQDPFLQRVSRMTNSQVLGEAEPIGRKLKSIFKGNSFNTSELLIDGIVLRIAREIFGTLSGQLLVRSL